MIDHLTALQIIRTNSVHHHHSTTKLAAAFRNVSLTPLLMSLNILPLADDALQTKRALFSATYKYDGIMVAQMQRASGELLEELLLF